jgi:hypothetical protein
VPIRLLGCGLPDEYNSRRVRNATTISTPAYLEQSPKKKKKQVPLVAQGKYCSEKLSPYSRYFGFSITWQAGRYELLSQAKILVRVTSSDHPGQQTPKDCCEKSMEPANPYAFLLPFFCH